MTVAGHLGAVGRGPRTGRGDRSATHGAGGVRAAGRGRADLVNRLGREAAENDTWFKPIAHSEEEVATVFLISRAEEMEQSDPAYLAELQSWMRTDPGAVDGVPVEAVPSEDPHTRPSNWLIRDFVVGEREDQPAFLGASDPDAPPPAVERPTVVLMGTEDDDRYAWLLAGRALGRVLLHATAAGVSASPLTQALDWPATRTRMQSRLSLVGHPQMLLRMGYAPPEAAGKGRQRPASHRRRAAIRARQLASVPEGTVAHWQFSAILIVQEDLQDEATIVELPLQFLGECQAVVPPRGVVLPRIVRVAAAVRAVPCAQTLRQVGRDSQGLGGKST